MLAQQPGAVRSTHHMVLEDERLQAALLVEGRRLLVVHRSAEDVGRGMDMCIHEAEDRADRRRRWWEARTCANTSRGSTTVAKPAAPTIATQPVRNSRRAAS